MKANSFSRMAALCLIVVLLVGMASAIGVFYRGDMSAVEVVSVRGERYEMITDGIYQYNSKRLAAEGVGWDIFTLFLAVPAMLAALPLLARGSVRARLFALGLLAYFFYQYFMYALTWAFGPLFLLFILIYALSLVAGLWVLSSIDTAELKKQVSGEFPRRGMIALSLFMSFILLAMWLQRISMGLQGNLEEAMLLGQTTMVVQALDLGLVVPLALVTGIVLWRRQTVGYLLSPVLAVKALAMAAAISTMLLSAWAVEGSPEVAPLAIFGGTTVAAAYLCVRMFKSLRTV